MHFEAAVFFACVMLFTWVGYPALAFLLSKVMPRRPKKAPFRPALSIILPVHDEGPALEAKIRNILAQGYPRALREIIVVDDGSDDGAVESLPPELRRAVRVITLPVRRGKACALNAGIQAATGEILIFTDARQKIKRGSIQALLKNFYDHRVTAVTGALRPNAGRAESLFRRYEEALRRFESAWGSPAGATGAFYAVRRRCAAYLPEDTILDDLVISMTAAARGRLVYEPQAVAVEPHQEAADTWRRRLRTLAGNWQIVLHPLRYRRIFSRRTAFQLFSHKFLRLVSPISAAGLALSLAPSAPLAAATAAVGIGATIVLSLLPAGGFAGAAAELARSLFVAPVRALTRYLRGRETVLWQRR